MADTVAQIDVQVTLDTKDYDKGIADTKKSAEDAGNSIGGKIAGGLKTMAKVGVASFTALVGGAVAFGKQSYDAFSEANESFTKFTQIAANNKWSKDQQSSLQDLNAELQRTGVVEGDALTAGQAQLGTFMLTADTVKTLTPALADMVAQQKGAAATADDVAQMSNLVGKVMTGNVGALSRYGVTLTDTQKKTLEMGTESERAAMLADVLGQNFGGVNQALGATSQGALVQAKNAFGDVQEAIGGILTGEASFEELDNAITAFADSLGPLIDQLLPSVVGVVGNLLQTLANKLPAIFMQILPPVLSALTTLINTLGPMLPGIINTLLPPLIQGFLVILQAIVQATPQIVEGLVNMLPAIIDGLVQLTIAVAQALPQIVTALVDALPTVLPQIIDALTSPEFISAMIGAGVTLFLALVQAIPKILGALVGAFGKLFGNLWDAIKKLATNIGTSIGDVVGGVFKSIVNGVISFFEGFINTPIKAINGVIGVVDAIVPGNQSGWKLKEVKFGRLANGGFAANGASANIIGEAGNEVALPLERNTAGWAKPLADILAAEMVAFGGGGDTIINMNVTATTQADWNDIAGQAARQLRLMKAGA